MNACRMDVRELLARGRSALAVQAAGPLEAEVLMGKALGVSRAWLYANPEHVPDGDTQTNYLELIERRAGGEPVAYLTGSREFWSLPLKVTPEVLIPRPETELLVETALAFIPTDAAWRVADLGTGSGAVALAICSERPSCEVHASECSEAALEVARENGRCIAAGKIEFHLGSWLVPLEGIFQVIVSNPPYVASDDPHLRQGDCRFEPEAALTPGCDALAAIRQISRESRRYLAHGGMLAFEHGHEQADAVQHLLGSLGYRGVETRNDLEDRPRVTSGIWD
jgi:release factor glutamine methyltransferase